MDEPERIVKELWYAISEIGGENRLVYYPTVTSAIDTAAVMLREGARSVQIARIERDPA